jgi:CO dehydrogenase maturation factor
MMDRGYTIAVSGKGGTGKTFFSSILVEYFSRFGSVLAIDADPDSNLPEALGVEVRRTIGDAREEILEGKTNGLTTSNSKQQAFETKIMELMIEEEKFDLLVMGRSEGEGCYCVINNILRQMLDSQSQNYDTVIIDCEAGLEHLSRRTTRNVDLMVIITDGSTKGVMTAKRIKELSGELHVHIGRHVLVANKVLPEMGNPLKLLSHKANLKIVGFIPYDPIISDYDLKGKSFRDLPESSIALRAAKEICENIKRIRDGKNDGKGRDSAEN